MNLQTIIIIYDLMHVVYTQTEDSVVLKTGPLSASATSSASRSRPPTSRMSSLHLRPQISVKLPAISTKRVQKNPDQLTIEDLPTIRSQVPLLLYIYTYTDNIY